MNKTILLLWLLTVVLLILQVASAYPQLPDRVISHVNIKGEPDGESSKGSLFSTLVMAIVAVNIWPPVVGIIVRKAPATVINMPNKDYWLGDPARRAQAANMTTGLMAALMALVNICFLVAFQGIIDLNLVGEVRIPMWWMFVPLAASVVLVPIFIFRSYKVPSENRRGPRAL